MSRRTIERIVKQVSGRARFNRPVTPHVLRHAFSATALQKGISVPALQRLLGQERMTTAVVFVKLSPEDVIREFITKW